MPSGLFMPLEANTLQHERFTGQLDASIPLKKQLWMQTVQVKIANQAAVLAWRGMDTEPMNHFRRSVKSGDPDNYEGRAAAYYWKNLFQGILDSEFTRGRNDAPPNNMLNYGYAILRAVIARSLAGSGLNPTLGIHHDNRYNAFCLADDIMEPYRPYVDKLVVDAVQLFNNPEELTTEIKRYLLAIPAMDVTMEGNKSPLMIAAQRTANSLRECFEGFTRKIIYPVL
jgi:CRISPR-associated protein Cas1